MRASISLVSAAVLALTGVAAAPVASSAATVQGTVVSVVVDPGPFTVDGFSGQAQSLITVVVDSPTGTIAPDQMDWDYTGIEAVLVRTAGGPAATATVDLPLASATATTGTYSGVWRIAATRGGTWTLTTLNLAPGDSVDPRVTLGVTPTVTVVATNAPTASLTLVPGTVPYFNPMTGVGPLVQRAHITFRTASGAPIVGAKVLWGTEYSCNDPMPPTPGGTRGFAETALTTDAAGQVSGKLILDFGPGQTCVSLLGPSQVPGDSSTSALVLRVLPYPHMYYRWVSATPSSRTVRVGHTLTLTGSTSPTPFIHPNLGTVRLQRLVGRTAWRTVATSSIHPSGRYVVSTTVTRLGRAFYRVVALHSEPVLAPTASRVLIVSGTLR